ncbi:MAG: hypothetical protein R2705_08415 [Ilumatobacteraceae bacterium]
MSDVDAYYCAGDAPGFGGISMADYFGLRCRTIDTTEIGGASYVAHVGHAAAMIAMGKASVALITLAGKPRTGGAPPGQSGAATAAPEHEFESLWGGVLVGWYAMAARRHMHEFGTTSAQLAEIKVAASLHAQHNPNAFLPTPVTVEEVIESPLIADPLHRLDCCVITDGGGARGRQSGDRPHPRPPLRQGPRARRGGEAHRRWPNRPHPHRGDLVRAARLRRSGRRTRRHQVRLDLRLVHDHRARSTGGSGVLRAR